MPSAGYPPWVLADSTVFHSHSRMLQAPPIIPLSLSLSLTPLRTHNLTLSVFLVHTHILLSKDICECICFAIEKKHLWLGATNLKHSQFRTHLISFHFIFDPEQEKKILKDFDQLPKVLVLRIRGELKVTVLNLETTLEVKKDCCNFARTFKIGSKFIN